MKVWVVSRGELGEGSITVGIFKNKKDATACALEEPWHFSGGWQESEGTEKDLKSWVNGCDIVQVERWEVR